MELTPTEYRAELKRLGLSVRGARHFLGVSERTTRRWGKKGERIPEPAARLLLSSTPEDVQRCAKERKFTIHPLTVQSDRAD